MRLAIVGDSQAEGLIPWLDPLLRSKGHQVVGTWGLRGTSVQELVSSRTLLESLLHEIRGAKGAVVALGGNNRIQTPSRYRELLDSFIQELRNQGIQTIWWVGPAKASDPSSASSHLRTRRIQRQVMRSFPVRWMDGWLMTEDLRNLNDGVHFPSEGYRIWARRIADTMDSSMGPIIGAALLGASIGVLFALRT